MSRIWRVRTVNSSLAAGHCFRDGAALRRTRCAQTPPSLDQPHHENKAWQANPEPQRGGPKPLRAAPLGLCWHNLPNPGLRDIRFTHVAPPWADLGTSLRDCNQKRDHTFFFRDNDVTIEGRTLILSGCETGRNPLNILLACAGASLNLQAAQASRRMSTSLRVSVKAQGRADACGMFTEPSGPSMASSVARSDPGQGQVREGAAPKEPPLLSYTAGGARWKGATQPNPTPTSSSAHRTGGPA